MTRDAAIGEDALADGPAPVQSGAKGQSPLKASAGAGDGAPYESTRVTCLAAGFFTRCRRIPGFTLVELLIAIAVIGALAAIAVPNYRRYIERAQIVKTIADMKMLETEIYLYNTDNGVYPPNLAAIGRDTLLDIWGHPYQYVNIGDEIAADEKAKQSGKTSEGTKFRKYLSEKPLGTDFDLYSMGPDGDSKPALTAKASRDDIIRANNGGYYGKASDF